MGFWHNDPSFANMQFENAEQQRKEEQCFFLGSQGHIHRLCQDSEGRVDSGGEFLTETPKMKKYIVEDQSKQQCSWALEDSHLVEKRIQNSPVQHFL